MDKISNNYYKTDNSKKLIVWILILTLVLTSQGLFVFGLESPSNEAIKYENIARDYKKEKVRVGWVEIPSFFQIEMGGKRSGYAYEYLMKIAEYTGWEYEFVPCTFAEASEKLKNKELDIIAPRIKDNIGSEIFEYPSNNVGDLYTSIFIYSKKEEEFKTNASLKNGMRIGLLKTSSLNPIFFNYVKDQGMTVSEVYYDTIYEMKNACKKGEVEAIVLPDLVEKNDFLAAQYLDIAQFFFVSYKGNLEIASSIDEAIGQIKKNDRMYEEKLMDKYYIRSRDYRISFTEKEIEYIRNNPELKILYSIDKKPIEYQDEKTGKPKGISIEILNEISRNCGIKFNFEAIDNLEIGVERVNDGDAEAVAGLINEKSFATDYNVVQTNTYANTELLLIGNKLNSYDENRQMTVVINKNYFVMPYFVKKYYPNFKISLADTMNDALKMVLTKKVDFLVINTNMAENVLKGHRYETLSNVNIGNTNFPIAITLSNNVDPILVSILNKAIEAVDTQTIDYINYKYTVGMPYEATLIDWFYENIKIIFFAIILFSMAIILILVWSNKKQEKLTFYDKLTGKKNLVRFKIEADKIIKDNKRTLAIACIDLNKFKAINNLYGYDFGDMILKLIAAKIEEILSEKEDEIFCRATGDRYYMLFNFTSEDDFAKRLKKIVKEVEYVKIEGYPECRIVIKCGVYCIQAEDNNIDTIIDRADVACQLIEASYNASYKMYDQKMSDAVNLEKSIENTMDYALKEKQFEVYLQPKVNMETKETVGAEALIRWNHPEKGLVMPGSFIELFEHNGFIVKLDFYVFERVCQVMQGWKEKGTAIKTISVNLSRRHLADFGTAKKLRGIADSYGVKPSLLEIELTESVFIDYEKGIIKQFMGTLKAEGFSISIDDFGSGYSSLGMLAEFSADVVKLDRTFMLYGNSEQEIEILLESICGMLKKLGIKIVAEGIETVEQVELLIKSGCEIAQGYLFAKPMTIDDFEKFQENH